MNEELERKLGEMDHALHQIIVDFKDLIKKDFGIDELNFTHPHYGYSARFSDGLRTYAPPFDDLVEVYNHIKDMDDFTRGQQRALDAKNANKEIL